MTKKKLLIVDDEPMILKIITTALDLQKYEIDTAHNRHTAEALVNKNKYDLVVCDVFLPDTEMLEFVDFLKEIDLDYRIILMSGYLRQDGFGANSDEVNTINTILMLADRKGVSSVLYKPFSLETLRAKVENALAE